MPPAKPTTMAMQHTPKMSYFARTALSAPKMAPAMVAASSSQ